MAHTGWPPGVLKEVYDDYEIEKQHSPFEYTVRKGDERHRLRVLHGSLPLMAQEVRGLRTMVELDHPHIESVSDVYYLPGRGIANVITPWFGTIVAIQAVEMH